MSTTNPEIWSVAVCLYDRLTPLDFQGPVGLFGFLAPEVIANKPEVLEQEGSSPFKSVPKVALDLHYLSVSLDPVVTDSGPKLVPTDLYSAEKQYDVLLVPGGSNGNPQGVPKELLEFLKKQAPKAKYVLTVCTGSWILAATGLLDGKRATTNKFTFNMVKETTSKSIEWVPKARWVVDGNYWTSSGVTAGADMANAFLQHIVGEETAKQIRGIIELSSREEGDDEFADFYGLV
ncbi:class I glutamine amidotransferase-like protein [Schizopora paradoxa]|uniref:Class I glutamine amidotransferase-like protein n=1 Tax=Schizopora paradoxa TaxID=27342 RepID=A0A0H2SBH7_9AGAM|nr:class I glutamine amidotransferase-like protein [Schizopora paradoxa]